jgi:hypothetical protein
VDAQNTQITSVIDPARQSRADVTEKASTVTTKVNRESHILNLSVRGFLTILVTATVCYMGLRAVKVEEPLYSMSFLCLGYYFGQANRLNPNQLTK